MVTWVTAAASTPSTPCANGMTKRVHTLSSVSSPPRACSRLRVAHSGGLRRPCDGLRRVPGGSEPRGSRYSACPPPGAWCRAVAHPRIGTGRCPSRRATRSGQAAASEIERVSTNFQSGGLMSYSVLVPMVLVVALLYFVPTVVAIVRSVPNRGSVIVVNVFLGWTVLGWIIALAMAARSGPPRSYT
ncbi:superinfection immunity protein [Streptomyces sp. TLI_105]|uniref:superinfection immunity protein n=1 Tax=Streptomyces sp. TLI_105 TaxID=1881019 RepID=UPI0035252904